jgi:hypothetical protein
MVFRNLKRIKKQILAIYSMKILNCDRKDEKMLNRMMGEWYGCKVTGQT